MCNSFPCFVFSSTVQASAVLPPSSSLQSLVPSSSLPASLWCHGSLAPGGEGRREEGMLGRRDGRREEGRGWVGCCHLFPCSYHHSADKQSTCVRLAGRKSKYLWISFGLKRVVAKANGVTFSARHRYHFISKVFSVSKEKSRPKPVAAGVLK